MDIIKVARDYVKSWELTNGEYLDNADCAGLDIIVGLIEELESQKRDDLLTKLKKYKELKAGRI